MDTPEGTEICPERRARSFTTVAVDFTAAITSLLPGPFAGAVAHGGMGRVAAMITLPLIGGERRAAGGDVVSHQVATGVPVRMGADPPALLARVARDHTDDGRAIVGIRPVPLVLVGAPPGGICRVKVRRAFCPPHCGRVRRPQRLHHAAQRSGRSRPGGLESAAAGDGVGSATAPVRGRGGRSAHPRRARGVAAPASLVVAASGRRPSPSAG